MKTILSIILLLLPLYVKAEISSIEITGTYITLDKGKAHIENEKGVYKVPKEYFSNINKIKQGTTVQLKLSESEFSKVHLSPSKVIELRPAKKK